MDEPTIFARMLEFFWALGTYWWTLVPSGVLMIVPILESHLLEDKQAIIDAWWPKKNRARHIRWVSAAAVLVAAFLAFDDVNTRNRALQRQLAFVPTPARHLKNEERVQLITSLRASGGANQSVEINSASNCDECEEYAQELREVIGSVPGWKVTGGTTIFGNASIRGIRLYVRSLANRAQAAMNLAAAFDAANIQFDWIEDESLQRVGYEYLILVARQVRQR
jgi:hypothetical protein